MVLLGSDKDGWRRYYCTVCGHVEWVAPGEELPAHYCCSLCGAKRSAMLALDDPRLARHGVKFKEIARGVWQVEKQPAFHEEWNHCSYVLCHGDGLVLYDAPPFITAEAVERVRGLGRPRLLVLSHNDFVGLASDWAEALSVPAWMGEGESLIAGNRLSPVERVGARLSLADDLEVVPVPGHSPGSLALYWSGAPDGSVLFAGDAITVWHHKGGELQLAFFQEPPAGEAIEELARRPVSLLATCGGALKDADRPLKRLLETSENCARPWRGERGGIWLQESRI